MQLEHRPVTLDTLTALFDLKVTPAQDVFVAPNSITIAHQAYAKGTYVWGLWDGDLAVGLMAMIHPKEFPDPDEGDDLDAAYIWRLMIDARHQGKGYGRAALDIARGIGRDWSLPRLSLTFVDQEGSAEAFYTAYGFARSGRETDEVEMKMDID